MYLLHLLLVLDQNVSGMSTLSYCLLLSVHEASQLSFLQLVSQSSLQEILRQQWEAKRDLQVRCRLL